LIFLGILIAGTALGVPPGEDENILPPHPEWLGWACILAGPLCFILFGSFFGLIPGHLRLRVRVGAWRSQSRA
jgi:hypothetical protein